MDRERESGRDSSVENRKKYASAFFFLRNDGDFIAEKVFWQRPRLDRVICLKIRTAEREDDNTKNPILFFFLQVLLLYLYIFFRNFLHSSVTRCRVRC